MSQTVKVGFLLLTLGFGVLALAAMIGGPQQAPGAFVASPPAAVELQISQSVATARCEEAVGRALAGRFAPQFTASAIESRPLEGGGRLSNVKFTAKNSRNIDLEFGAWCEVWPDERTGLVSLIEIAGKDYLVSSHPSALRNAHLQNMKIAKYQVDANRFTAIMANRNDFSIKGTELACRIIYSEPARYEDRIHKIARIVPAGGTTVFQLSRPLGAQSVTCKVADFFKIGPDEQRLIEIFGQEGGQTSYARLRQDAMRFGSSIDLLVEPYIALVGTLATYRR